MRTAPTPDADEIRDNAAFEATLWALSRPGQIRNLPAPGVLTVVHALIDRECRACAEDISTQTALGALGAQIVPVHQADHAILPAATETDTARIAQLHTGDALYPESGATVIVPARIGSGTALRLTGPGVETQTQLDLDDVHPSLWAIRARLCAYPLGIDMIFVDDMRVAALPRSTMVEVL